jgi:hypothetical protein
MLSSLRLVVCGRATFQQRSCLAQHKLAERKCQLADAACCSGRHTPAPSQNITTSHNGGSGYIMQEHSTVANVALTVCCCAQTCALVLTAGAAPNSKFWGHVDTVRGRNHLNLRLCTTPGCGLHASLTCIKSHTSHNQSAELAQTTVASWQPEQQR